MTEIITVTPGQDDLVVSGPQFGVKYTLQAPDGARAVFNDPADIDYVGWLSDLTGLDSPDLREAADDLVGDDGGVHGEFYYGRRPLVLEGMIESRPDNISRNTRMTRLQRASNVTRQDAVLRWAPEGGVEQMISVRRQQPLRITGGFNKSFQLALVAADPRIYAAANQSQRINPNTTSTITNRGSMRTPPVMTITGPASNIIITNNLTNEKIKFLSTLTVPATFTLDIDFANRTILASGANGYASLDYLASTWFELYPGRNDINWTATGTTGATSMLVTWRDAWV